MGSCTSTNHLIFTFHDIWLGVFFGEMLSTLCDLHPNSDSIHISDVIPN
jgi:hypothetical protein